jgi:acyl carrier protein
MQNSLDQLLLILDESMNLRGEGLRFVRDTKLRGSLPQLDSMAVVAIIAAIEDQFGIEFPEDALEGATFETVGTLAECIDRLVTS